MRLLFLFVWFLIPANTGVTCRLTYDTLKRMSTFIDPLEKLWDTLLSREPQQIKHTFDALDNASQMAVIDHLNRMATEEGWLDEQRSSALIALEAIGKKPVPNTGIIRHFLHVDSSHDVHS
jgi:hypothetical protein